MREKEYICTNDFIVENDFDGFELDEPFIVKKGTVWTSDEDGQLSREVECSNDDYFMQQLDLDNDFSNFELLEE